MKRVQLQMMEDIFVDSLSDFGEEVYAVRNRECVFSPALTLWLFINQRTSSGISLRDALENLRSGGGGKIFRCRTETRKGKVTPLSMDTSGFSKARQRLSLEFVKGAAKAISSRVRLLDGKNTSWRGKKVYLLDGTRVDLHCTEDIEEHYPRSSNQHGKVQQPKMLCMFMHDLMTGVAVNPVYGAWRGGKATSEQMLSKEILPQAEEGSLIIGDRNLGVFSLAYTAEQCGHEVLLRLTTGRVKALFGDDLLKAKVDKEVHWKASAQTLQNNPEIPSGAGIRGRVIKRMVKDSKSQPLELLFFTTSSAPANALVNLYQEREKIEHDIRSLKCTLQMEMLSGKTAEMV